MSTDDVHCRLEHARVSEGQTEVHRVLDWNEPPSEIVFHSKSEMPQFVGGDPGPEVAELAEIAAWFQERGLILVWTGRAVGSHPGAMRSTHSANLIDMEADELVQRFEAPGRVEAVRKAQQWWLESREGRTHTASADVSGGGHIEASGQVTPHVPPEDLEALKRFGRVVFFTEPDPDDPESRWLADVRDAESGRILDFATGYSAEEAFITIRPSILPPDDRT